MRSATTHDKSTGETIYLLSEEDGFMQIQHEIWKDSKKLFVGSKFIGVYRYIDYVKAYYLSRNYAKYKSTNDFSRKFCGRAIKKYYSIHWTDENKMKYQRLMNFYGAGSFLIENFQKCKYRKNHYS